MVYHRPLLGHLVGVVQKLLSRWFLDPKSTITCSCPMGRWARGSMKNKAFSFKPAHRVAAMNSSARRRTSGGTFKKNTHRQLATRRPSLKESSVSGKPYYCIIWRKKNMFLFIVHQGQMLSKCPSDMLVDGRKIVHRLNRLRLWRMWSFYRRFTWNGWSRKVTPDHMTPVRSHVQQGDQAL